MKYFRLAIIWGIFVYFNTAQSKSLKSFYGNSIDQFKGQGKPFASSLANAIHDGYKRAKREVPEALTKLQEEINEAKEKCVREMKMDDSVLKKSLIEEDNPTDEEKCLIKCLLMKTDLMDDNNKISAKTVASVAGAMSGHNPLVVSIAMATANKCNKSITEEKPCEAAHQINKCLGKELKAHKLNLNY